MQMWVPSAFEKENHKKLYHAKYKMQILEKNHFKKFLTNDDFEKASSFFFFSFLLFWPLKLEKQITGFSISCEKM